MALEKNFPLRFEDEDLKIAVKNAADQKKVSINTFINNCLKRSIRRSKGA